LEDLYASGDTQDAAALAKQIVDTSLACHVLSRFTAYVAVDRGEVVNQGGRQSRIVQPVELPRGWQFTCLEDRMLLSASPPDTNIRGCCHYLYGNAGLCHHDVRPANASVLGIRDDQAALTWAAPQSTPQEPVWRGKTPAELTAAIRKIMTEIESLESAQGGASYETLRRLVSVLDELAGALRYQGHEAADDVTALVERGRELLANRAAAVPEIIADETVETYLEAVRNAIRLLAPPSTAAPEHERFWA
jgi:Ca-activated chloride channel family protein